MIETGVHFGEIHSFNDLNLVLSSVSISPAKPKTDYVDIPGGDGSIDMTEALGETRFYDRDCKFTFTVFPKDTKTFEEKKTEVANALNGKRCEIILDKDPDYHYIGRLTVDDWNQNGHLKQIVITAKVAPYKYKNSDTVVYVDVEGGTSKIIYLTNDGRKSVVPSITYYHPEESSGTYIILFENESYIVPVDCGEDTLDDTRKIPGICLKQGANKMTVSSTIDTTLIFRWREGAL